MYRYVKKNPATLDLFIFANYVCGVMSSFTKNLMHDARYGSSYLKFQPENIAFANLPMPQKLHG